MSLGCRAKSLGFLFQECPEFLQEPLMQRGLGGSSRVRVSGGSLRQIRFLYMGFPIIKSPFNQTIHDRLAVGSNWVSTT